MTRLLALLSALAIAFFGALCGVGGGLFAVPLFHYGFKLPIRRAVALSLCLVATNALASTSSEILHVESAFRIKVVALLIGGALVGAQLGFVASKRLPENVTKLVFAVVIFGVALRLALAGESAVIPTMQPLDYGPWRIVAIVAIGMLAGFSSPLLGIGGGLIVMPGLDLLVPEMGQLGARAASLGMAALTSMRSVQLYARDGAVPWGLAPWVVAGALAGAVGGVQVVHLDGVASVARTAFIGLLFVTAARFAMDIFRSRRAGTLRPE